MQKKRNDTRGIANAYGSIGLIYAGDEKYDQALEYYNKALEMQRQLKDVVGVSITLCNMGTVYLEQKKYEQSEKYLLESIAISDEVGDVEGQKECSDLLSQLYEAMGKTGPALKYYKRFMASRDSLLNEEHTKNTVRLEMNYEFEKKQTKIRLEQEKKEALAAAESKKQRIIIYGVCGILVLVISFAIFAYRSYLEKQKANIEISKQKEIIEHKQKEILDSILYARRIQRALITNERYIQRSLDRLENDESQRS